MSFEPPGPGGWKRLADHFPGALTPEYQRLYAETCRPGTDTYMAEYGVLARGLDVRFVHGHLYVAPIPLAGPREFRRAPSTTAVWLMSRLHPRFRRRTRAARHALATRPWRAAADRWVAAEQQEWIARDQAIQDEDPTELDAAELADHLRRARDLVAAGYRRHFELHGADLIPVGLLLARCGEWGIDPDTVAAGLTGPSPRSAAVPMPPAWQLVTGYDLDALAWCEIGPTDPPRLAVAPELVDLRPLVPPAARDELDRLIADARAAVPLRDDNGALTAAWPMGLLRRAMLEAGRRIGLHERHHAIELTVDELARRLAGASAPAADTAAERAQARRIASELDAPITLGPEFAVPPLHALPRPLALIGAAQLAIADHMLASTRTTGIGIGTRSHTGRALVVDDPNTALSMIEPGDVLITAATSPSWNVVLAHAGALVTTTGGLLSHAAVIARELNIPALIGAQAATRHVTTGMTVTVDPIAASLSVATGPDEGVAVEGR
jgi:phosphohistidine swiveling domain-containing protein